jgi:hypothetical protein
MKQLMRSLLLVVGFATFAKVAAAPFAYAVTPGSDAQLFRIDVAGGPDFPAIGAVGFTDIEGLAFDPLTGLLFGVDSPTDQLITIDPATGAGTAVGGFGRNVDDLGLAFGPDGTLFMSSFGSLFTVDKATGAASLIGGSGLSGAITGIAFQQGTLYGILAGRGTSLLTGPQPDALVTIDPATGLATIVGSLGIDGASAGLDSDGFTLWGMFPVGDFTATIDPTTGAASLPRGSMVCPGPTADAVAGCGFQSLAIVPAAAAVPEPDALSLCAAGLMALVWVARQRRRGRA